MRGDNAGTCVILIGRELLKGFTQDVNGHWLAGRLFALGMDLKRIHVIDDDVDEIVQTVQKAVKEHRFVIVSGGLGATHDDVTVEAMGKAFGLPLVEHKEAVTHLEQALRFLRQRGVIKRASIDAQSRKMALLPEGATVLPNRAGLAVGFALAVEGGTRTPRPARVFVLPGVPRELEAVWTDGAEPLLKDEGLVPQHVEEVVIRGIEHEISDHLADVVRDHPDVTIGSYPRTSKKEIVLRIIGAPEAVEKAAAACRALGEDGG